MEAKRGITIIVDLINDWFATLITITGETGGKQCGMHTNLVNYDDAYDLFLELWLIKYYNHDFFITQV